MGDRPSVLAHAAEARAQSHDGPARGIERFAVSGSLGRRLAHAAQGSSAGEFRGQDREFRGQEFPILFKIVSDTNNSIYSCDQGYG